MSEHSIATTQKAAPTVSPVQNGALLQRQCACGQHTMGAECEGCKKKSLTVQRKASDDRTVANMPTVVQEVLRSPGQPLDTETRAFMEPRFGHDFSGVR